MKMKIIQSLKLLINRFGLAYTGFVCAREYRRQTYTGINERPIEFAYLFRQLVNKWPITVLDVGTGMTSLPHLMRNCGFLVTATDNVNDYWPAGMLNRHYLVINDDITRTQIKEKFDLITCISVLEHIKDHRGAMRSIFKLLNPGGWLVLTCPYNESQYIDNVYKLPESSVVEDIPFISQSFSRKEINHWLTDSPFKLIDQECWQFFEGDFWTCGPRIIPPIKVEKGNLHQLSCMTFEKSMNKDALKETS